MQIRMYRHWSSCDDLSCYFSWLLSPVSLPNYHAQRYRSNVPISTKAALREFVLKRTTKHYLKISWHAFILCKLNRTLTLGNWGGSHTNPIPTLAMARSAYDPADPPWRAQRFTNNSKQYLREIIQNVSSMVGYDERVCFLSGRPIFRYLYDVIMWPFNLPQ